MLKRTMLIIVAVTLLAGIENLLAQERPGQPQAQVQQKQAQGHRGLQQGQGPVIQQRLDRLLAALAKAYRENDREQMRQVLRRIKQLRQRRPQEMGARGVYMRRFGGWGEVRKGRWGMFREGRLGQFRSGAVQGFQRRGMGWQGFGVPPGAMRRQGPALHQGRGMGGWDQGFPRRGMGQQGFVPPGAMGRQGPALRGRGMSRRGQGFQHRDMDGWSWDDDMLRGDFDW